MGLGRKFALPTPASSYGSNTGSTFGGSFLGRGRNAVLGNAAPNTYTPTTATPGLGLGGARSTMTAAPTAPRAMDVPTPNTATTPTTYDSFVNQQAPKYGQNPADFMSITPPAAAADTVGAGSRTPTDFTPRNRNVYAAQLAEPNMRFNNDAPDTGAPVARDIANPTPGAPTGIQTPRGITPAPIVQPPGAPVVVGPASGNNYGTRGAAPAPVPRGTSPGSNAVNDYMAQAQAQGPVGTTPSGEQIPPRPEFFSPMTPDEKRIMDAWQQRYGQYVR